MRSVMLVWNEDSVCGRSQSPELKQCSARSPCILPDCNGWGSLPRAHYYVPFKWFVVAKHLPVCPRCWVSLCVCYIEPERAHFKCAAAALFDSLYSSAIKIHLFQSPFSAPRPIHVCTQSKESSEWIECCSPFLINWLIHGLRNDRQETIMEGL
jgi:hypothetical protein